MVYSCAFSFIIVAMFISVQFLLRGFKNKPFADVLTKCFRAKVSAIYHNIRYYQGDGR